MINKLFKPKIYTKDIKEVDLNYLKDIGVKLIILDIDNTLVAFDKETVNQEALRFVKQIKSAGIIPVIISNNIEKRVQNFATALDCDYISFGLKPFKLSYLTIINKYRLSSSEICIIGDQNLTDILGGNRMGMLTILVDPIKNKDNFYGSFIRIMEKIILRFIDVKKGEYYE